MGYSNLLVGSRSSINITARATKETCNARRRALIRNNRDEIGECEHIQLMSMDIILYIRF